MESQSTVRTHDGLYLRAGVGLGWGRVRSESDIYEGTLSGGGVQGELLCGGTLSGFIVVGGGLAAQALRNPSLVVDKGEDRLVADSDQYDSTIDVEGDISGKTSLLVLGPFIDLYLNPKGGAHAGAVVGLGRLGLDGKDDKPSSGWGFSLFAGYDFWVGDQWALGAGARFMQVRGQRDVGFPRTLVGGPVYFEYETVKDVASAFALTFSGLYN